MAGNIYDVLLQMGTPPEKVLDLINRIQGNKQAPLFESQSMGMRGNVDALNRVPMSGMQQGVRGTVTNEPRISSKLSYVR